MNDSPQSPNRGGRPKALEARQKKVANIESLNERLEAAELRPLLGRGGP